MLGPKMSRTMRESGFCGFYGTTKNLICDLRHRVRGAAAPRSIARALFRHGIRDSQESRRPIRRTCKDLFASARGGIRSRSSTRLPGTNRRLARSRHHSRRGALCRTLRPGPRCAQQAGVAGHRGTASYRFGLRPRRRRHLLHRIAIVHSGHNAELRLGFDEQPTRDRIELALGRMLWLLAAYLGVAVGIAVILSYRLSRPIHRLGDVSRAIASGDYAQVLNVSTGIRELHELASDLEGMRRELVGVNHRLQAKIKEKEISEVRREELQKQLRHRQRLETVGTLAGGIAHEINNVLVPIILFTETALQDLPPSSASRADLVRVLAAARRAKDVVKKILTFSRELDDAKVALIDLRSVVTEGLHLFSVLAPPSIEIRTEIGEGIPLVKADATLALHLVINLCTNAYQAMAGAEGVLTIGLRYQDHPVDGSISQPRVEFW